MPTDDEGGVVNIADKTREHQQAVMNCLVDHYGWRHVPGDTLSVDKTFPRMLPGDGELGITSGILSTTARGPVFAIAFGWDNVGQVMGAYGATARSAEEINRKAEAFVAGKRMENGHVSRCEPDEAEPGGMAP